MPYKRRRAVLRVITFVFLLLTVNLLLCADTSFGRGVGQRRSPLQMNGKDWAELSESQKLIFLAGFNMGCYVPWREVSKLPAMEASRREVEHTFKLLSFAGFTGTEIRDAINKVYKDPQNQKIAIVDAVYLAKMLFQDDQRVLANAQTVYLRMQPIDAKRLRSARQRVYIHGKLPTPKEIISGKVSIEDVITCGYYMREDGSACPLFYYGEYD